MFINNIEIKNFKKPILIAEMSGNHNQSLDKALAIVNAAADSGAHILKLQTYTPDTITLDAKGPEFYISDPRSLWKGQKLHDLYQSAYTPWEWHEQIIKEANKLGMTCFSSPFDESAVDFLEDLNVPAYKIASFENNHIPLIKKVASTGKPVIVSTGLASISDLEDVVNTLKENGCNDFVLLKCTSTYPASPSNSNILTIPHMMNLFNCDIGLSDHTLGIGTSIAAVSHGACLIEKHFTLDRKEGGVDSQFSLEPNEFKLLVEETERAWNSLGNVYYGPTADENNASKKRRSIYISKDLKKGEVLSNINLKIIRPGLGLRPNLIDTVLGRKISRDVMRGTALTWDLIE